MRKVSTNKIKEEIKLINFIIEYWIEWLFGIVALGVGLWLKRWYKLEKDKMIQIQKEKAEELRAEVKDEIITKVKTMIHELEDTNKKQSADIEALYCAQENLTTGILSLQGKQYKEFCRFLLTPGHEITIDEYEQEELDYNAYKGLGGNGKGDTLHQSVVTKYEAQIAEGVHQSNG